MNGHFGKDFFQLMNNQITNWQHTLMINNPPNVTAHWCGRYIVNVFSVTRPKLAILRLKYKLLYIILFLFNCLVYWMHNITINIKYSNNYNSIQLKFIWNIGQSNPIMEPQSNNTFSLMAKKTWEMGDLSYKKGKRISRVAIRPTDE